MADPRVFAARDVLDEWLSCDRSRIADETEPTDRSSSRWVRWARIHALLRAFELGSPVAFASGEFLDGKDLDRYPRSQDTIRAYLKEVMPWRNDLPASSLRRLFEWLLHYRCTAQRLLDVNSGWQEIGSPGLIAAVLLTKEVNQQVAPAFAEVDALLLEMIDPDDRRIAERDVAGWPDVDLQQLVIDEWVG